MNASATRYEVIEFKGKGDPYFGGSADDRPSPRTGGAPSRASGAGLTTQGEHMKRLDFVPEAVGVGFDGPWLVTVTATDSMPERITLFRLEMEGVIHQWSYPTREAALAAHPDARGGPVVAGATCATEDSLDSL